jgi:hypothetical protein
MDREIQDGTAVAQEAAWEAVMERTPTLRRTLRGLHDAMLAALVRGLEKHVHELVPGRLFRDRDGGGCAVGLMLRELDPERYESRSALRFWLRDRWRRRAHSYPELARNPRLRHLEWIFDRSVEELLGVGAADQRAHVTAAVGHWILSEAQLELNWRRARTALELSGAGRATPTGGEGEPTLDLSRR